MADITPPKQSPQAYEPPTPPKQAPAGDLPTAFAGQAPPKAGGDT